MSSRVRGADSPEQFSDITFLGLNQDQSCLAVGTASGFMIFSTETCALLHHEECGAVSVVEMLFRTSLVALVGNSARGGPGSSGRQLTMWNTKERCKICHLCFEALIYGVKMSHRRITVLLREEVHILDLKTMQSLRVIERAASPWIDPAVASLCPDHDCGYLALPMGLAAGNPVTSIGAENAPASPASGPRGEEKIGLVSIVDTHTLQPVGHLVAHQSPVQALALNLTGHMLATASTQATVVRVFSVPAMEMLCVFRRGTSPCRIFGLSFSTDSQFLSAAASSGTVHVFRSSDEMRAAVPSTPPSRGSPEPKGATPSLAAVRPVVRLGPESGLDEFSLPDAAVDEADIEEEELSDWNVLPERPERALEYLQHEEASRAPCLKRDAIQALSDSKAAVGNVAKHARSIFQLLPQSCRDLLDADRAFAVVRLREEEAPQISPSSSPQLGPSKAPSIADSLPAVSLSSVLGAARASTSSSGTSGMACSYVACALPKSSGGRLEVLVATRRGCAYQYDWGSSSGGEGRLRGEHSIAPDSFDALQQTPRSQRSTVGAAVTPSKDSVETDKVASLQSCNIGKEQLGA